MEGTLIGNVLFLQLAACLLSYQEFHGRVVEFHEHDNLEWEAASIHIKRRNMSPSNSGVALCTRLLAICWNACIQEAPGFCLELEGM